jgi:hypothetical protein
MTSRTLARVALAVAVLAAAAPTSAQPAAQASGAVRGRQAINIFIGSFVPRGEDGPAVNLMGGRALGDVLISTQVTYVHVEIADFKSATVGGEWLVPVGNRIEIGSGVSVSRQTVHTPYDGYIDTDGTYIVADLSLRIVPVSFTARVLPLGQASRLQPYVGGALPSSDGSMNSRASTRISSIYSPRRPVRARSNVRSRSSSLRPQRASRHWAPQ